MAVKSRSGHHPALHPPGVLACLDGFMNIALEQSEEFVDGKLTERFGDAFIRGNNGVWRCLWPATLPSILFAHAFL